MNDTVAEHPIFAHRPIGPGASASVPGRATLRTVIYAGIALFGVGLQIGAEGRASEGAAALPVLAVAASMEIGTPWDRSGSMEPQAPTPVMTPTATPTATATPSPHGPGPAAAAGEQPSAPALSERTVVAGSDTAAFAPVAQVAAVGPEAQALAALSGSTADKAAALAAFEATTPVEAAYAHLVLRQELREEIGRQINCLALNIYFEARNEPQLGQAAVAHVVMNRVSDPRFPDTACQVIRQGGERVRHRCQFSWWCDGLSDNPRNAAIWGRAQDQAHEVYWGRSEDPTAGALWYHADYVRPYWRRAFDRGPKIGRHIFYSPKDRHVQVANRGG